MRRISILFLVLCISACSNASSATGISEALPSATSKPVVTVTITESPTAIPVSAEYADLKVYLDNENIPYEILNGMLSIGGQIIVPNNLGLVIYSNKDGVNSYDPQMQAWKKVVFSDSNTYPKELLANYEQLKADLDNKKEYSQSPGYQQIIHKQVVLLKTEVVRAHWDEIEKYYGQVGITDPSQLDYRLLEIVYRAFEHFAPVDPVNTRQIFQDDKNFFPSVIDQQSIYPGLAPQIAIDINNPDFSLYLQNAKNYGPPVGLPERPSYPIFGVNTDVDGMLNLGLEGYPLGLDILPGQKSILISNIFMPGNKFVNQGFGIQQRMIALIESQSSFGFFNTNLIYFDSLPILPTRQDAKLDSPVETIDRLIKSIGYLTRVNQDPIQTNLGTIHVLFPGNLGVPFTTYQISSETNRINILGIIKSNPLLTLQ